MKVRFSAWLAVLVFAYPVSLYSQDDHNKEAIMNAISALIGGKWVVEGKWPNGGAFKQEQIYEWGLNKSIIKVKTLGSIDEKGTFGLRNEGIRAWDSKANVMKMWEFDVFGGITVGIADVEGNSHYFEYDYADSGKTRKFRDLWTKVGPDLYDYKVGIFEDGKWQSVFLESQYKRMSE